jgi:thioredoxin-like negative regulator of GroEL
MRIPTAVLVLLFVVLTSGVGTAAGNGPADGGEVRKPTVLVFGLGSRCRYCVQLKKEIGRVTEETGDAVQFRDILVDQDKMMVHRYRVLLSPTLVFLDAAGTEVFRHQGILNAQQILEQLVALEFWPRKG